MNNYKSLENKVNTFEGLTTLLEEYLSLFDRLEEIGARLREPSPALVLQLPRLILEVTGIYTGLNVVAGILESKMIWIKEKTAEDKRNKVLNDLDADTLEYYRRARNIFQRYTDNSEKIISSCQSRLKYSEKERVNETSKYS